MSFKDARDQIELNSGREFNCIPSTFNRFEPYFTGIMQRRYYIVTANSGIGKSKFTKNKFILEPYEFVKSHSDVFKLKIFYFCLEESKQTFILSVISTLLYEKYGISIGPNQLLSIGRTRLVSPELLAQIDSLADYYTEFEKHVEVIDYIRNPYGIYKHVRTYAREHGKFYFKGNQIDPEVTPAWDQYIPNDPNEYVIVITDHLGLLQPEKGGDLFSAIGKYSSDYCLTMRDKFGYSVVNVQQQSAEKEKQEFTFKGQSIESKLEPSLDGLGIYKNSQQDADMILGIFAPDRYGIVDHRGYNIGMLQDTYRQIAILKNRYGDSNVRIGMLFNGKTSTFVELPKAEELTTDQDYQAILNAL